MKGWEWKEEQRPQKQEIRKSQKNNNNVLWGLKYTGKEHSKIIASKTKEYELEHKDF